jgi:hypothetical protein
MTAAYFEDHPTDPEKVILRKPSLDQGADYERGFIDGMQKQMQSSVDKAVNRMAQTQEPVDHQKWCASLTQLLLSMPPQPAPCNCHPPQRTEQVCCQKYDTCLEPCTPRGEHLAQRTWVGLTDDEYFALQMKIKTPMISVQDYIDAMRMVEARLKEKNA